MISIIKKYLKIYDELTKTYSVRILTCSIVFSIVLMIIPLMMIISFVLDKIGLNINISNYTFQGKGIISSIIFIINLFWSTSTLMVTFNQISDTIYHTIDKRSYIKMRIKSFLLFLMFIVLILCLLIFIIVINYLISYFNDFKNLLLIIELLVEFIGVWFIIAFIYKKIIPVKIKFKNTLSTSLIITLIWYLLTNILFPIMKSFLIDSYLEIYKNYAYIFLFLYYLYIMAYVFIYGIIFQYFLYKKKNKE